MWLQGVAINLPQVQVELPDSHVEFTTLALYAGLILGATTWVIMADVVGRRLSFNITLFVAGVFGIAAGGAGTFTQLAALIACVGFGVGGKYAPAHSISETLRLTVYPQSSCRRYEDSSQRLLPCLMIDCRRYLPRSHPQDTSMASNASLRVVGSGPTVRVPRCMAPYRQLFMRKRC